MLRIGSCLVVLAAVLLGAAQAPRPDVEPAALLARSDAAWARRAEGQEQGRAQPRPIRQVIEAAEAGLAKDPLSIAARWRLLRALHFEGEFVDRAPDARRKVFDRAANLANASVAVLDQRLGRAGGLVSFLGPPQGVAEPASASEQMRAALRRAGVDAGDAARLHFWAAVAWSSWSRVHGLLGSLREGDAKRLYQNARVVCALEPGLEEGGSFRLLARLHAELPKMPLVSPWVDRDLAVPYAERARAIAPTFPGNRLVLGLTLLTLAPARRGEAIGLLQQVAQLDPAPKMLVEELAMRKSARAALEAQGPILPLGHPGPGVPPRPGRKAVVHGR